MSNDFLDTNILSELMKASPETAVIDWLDQYSATDLFISAITKAEIELGLALLPDGKRKRGLALAANDMFHDFTNRCLSFNEAAATQYALIVADRCKQGRPISVEDAQIASITLTYGFTLATRNIRDFECISELLIVNPFCCQDPSKSS